MNEIKPDDTSAETDSAGEQGTRTVELPTRIVDQVERRVDRTDFTSPSAYITFVLEEVLARVEEQGDREDDTSDAVTEDQVRSRLESLGYLE